MNDIESARILRILYLEDCLSDRQFVARALAKDGLRCEFTFADSLENFKAALEQSEFDLILSDFTLPTCDGDEALAIVGRLRPEIPFIFCSGTIGEEKAVASLKAGATDWVLKNHLGRLPGAIRRALREASLIAQRKEAQLRLAETAKRMQLLLESSGEGIYGTDLQGRCTFLNRTAAQLIGRTPEEVLGRNAHELLRHHKLDGSPYPEEDCPIFQIFQTGREHRSESEVFWRADGTAFPVEYSCRVTLEAGVATGSVVTFTDITARQRAAEVLRESEQRFRQVTESIDEVFWLTDLTKHQMVYISPAYERIWGRTCESLLASPASWMDAIHSEDRDRVKEALTLQATGLYDLEYRIVRPDGGERWIHDRAFPIQDAAGKVYRVAGVAADITKNRQLEEQFRQAQRMEAIGQFAGGIAHDFNNLLSVIQMQTSLLLTDPGVDSGIKGGIQEIMGAAERGADLTRRLLTFSRRETKRSKDLDLGEVLGNMIKLLRRIMGERISLETRFAPSLPLVNADPGMVEQVLMNLVINARDAMPDGGRLTVRLEKFELGAAEAAAKPGLAPGTFVCMQVCDTGCGIPRGTLPRIFEPFFTTKEDGKGTGLGLATVFGIVEQHHGKIEVESELNKGTTFKVFFPALQSLPVEAPAAPRPRPNWGNGELVLIVEDDLLVSALARTVLERYNYRILEAATTSAALAVWKEHHAVIDLLLTDFIIPGGISGPDLADKFLSDKPSLKVIYTSGYTDSIVAPRLSRHPGRRFLQKPFSVSDLTSTVRECLEGRIRSEES